MVRQGYRLTFVLLLAGSDLGTMQQTVAVAAESPDEAVEVAQRYRSTLPSAAIVSAILADATGAVLWSEQNSGGLDLEPPERDRP
jgi:hypothetical protein